MAREQSPQTLPDEVEQTLAAGEQDLAEIREMGSPAAALEQLDLKPAFEQSDGLRHGGLGKTDRRRRPANALMARYGLEHLQLTKAGKKLAGLHGSPIYSKNL